MKTSKTASVAVPTLAETMAMFAGGCAHLMTYAPSTDVEMVKTGCGLGGWKGTEMPGVVFEVTFTKGSDEWGPWTQATVGGQKIGNRYAALKAYSELCAPVLAWVAAYWTSKTEEKKCA